MEDLQLALMKAAMCGGAVSVAVFGAILLWPQLAGTCRAVRRRPVWERVLLAWLVAALIAYGGSKMPTNGVDQSKSGVEVEQWNLSTCSAGQSEQESNLHCTTTTTDYDYLPPTVTPEDIARGWRLWEVRTNADWSAAMPEGAALCTNWWLRGAYEDCSIVRLGDCSIAGGAGQSNNPNNPNNRTMLFPFGSNEWDSAWAFTWGKLRFALRDRATEIAAVGAPMAAVPYRSRLWTAADTNGSRLVTWENFTLGRVPAANYQLPTTNYQLLSAQVELRRNGDFVTRSNGVETVCRRIEPFDWDGDGILNEDDLSPMTYDGELPDPVNELPGGADSNCYYTASFAVDAPTPVVFVGDGPSDLPDPSFAARPGRTYTVRLLIGKTYKIEACARLRWLDASDEAVVQCEYWDAGGEVAWPVSFSVEESSTDAEEPTLLFTALSNGLWQDEDETGTFSINAEPSWLGGGFAWSEYTCCPIVSLGGNRFRFRCLPLCGCAACCAVFNYEYEGYSLFALERWCGCERGDPPMSDTPSVSVSFSEKVCMWDASATGSGRVAEVRPAVRLFCKTYGGANGGVVRLNVSHGGKLTFVGDGEVPAEIGIAPYETKLWDLEYFINQPSDRPDDVTASILLTDNETSENYDDEGSTTLVEVKTHVHCPWISDKGRRVLGVGEQAIVQTTPDYPDLPISVKGCSYSSEQWVYEAPFAATSETVVVSCRDVDLPLLFTIVEPMRVEAYACFASSNAPPGEAGGVACDFHLSLLPTNVSFGAVEIVEVARVSTNAIGYFADPKFSYLLDHGKFGGGNWHGVGISNRFFDRALIGVLPKPWGDGGSFTIPIPRAWRPSGAASVTNAMTHTSSYDQRFELDGDGTVRILKFDYVGQRMTNGVLTIRKEIQ